MAREPINDDAELVWGGIFGAELRPMSYGTLRKALDSATLLYLFGAFGVLPLAAGWVDVAGANRVGVAVAGLAAAASAALLAIVARSLSLDAVIRWAPPAAVISQLSAVLLIAGLVLSSGPSLGVTAVFYVEVPLFAFFLFRAPWAIGISAYVLATAALALWRLDGAVAPVEQWLIIVAAGGATAVLVGSLVQQTEEARRAERAAKGELAEVNRTLEARVAAQVEEIERIGRLRRFLAPQVADAVVSEGSESLLEPHRRDVAVLFCDLRGFTRFANGVDPDTVVSVLGDYYAAVGSVLLAHDATIGGFDGDGIMAYIGDPMPHADAAAAGAELAKAIGRHLDGLTDQWQAAGYDLGFGIGLAFGSATLGIVGFDGRYDYTPLGPVVNLAARLCSDAAHGEIVVDGSVRDEGMRERGKVALKGFADAISTYALER